MSTINKVTRRYTDINLIFNPHPYTKDILVRKNIDAVKTSIRNLILTKNYEPIRKYLTPIMTNPSWK